MIINSKRDLQNRVSGVVSEYWSRCSCCMSDVDLISEQGEEIEKAFAADLSSDAHDAGLRYGDDWAEFLEEHCTTERMCALLSGSFARGRVSR